MILRLILSRLLCRTKERSGLCEGKSSGLYDSEAENKKINSKIPKEVQNHRKVDFLFLFQNVEFFDVTSIR
ncbi:MAG: hypothetical protein KBT28_05150, partial [Bacteroidales bacterium]|nr:hypothetical protein [Candidatus Colimorpha merdihippi]